MSNVVIYSSNYCGFCFRAKSLLDHKNIAYREINVDMNPAARSEMRSKSHGGTSVPQILIGGDHVGGCDDLYALERDGKLDDLLKLA